MYRSSAEDLEKDWGLIADGEEPPSTSTQSSAPKKMKKPFALNNLFINTKSKFYNLCKPMSKSLPHFTSSPVVMLGVIYRTTPPRRIKPASRRIQQKREQQAASSKPLYLFFNKLSVVPVTDDIHVEPSPSTGSTSILPSHILSFLSDFRSRMWLTYRSNFSAIEGSSLVTDMGWGCMLRTGQMLLAHALLTHYLGREWRIQSGEGIMTFREVLRWFADEASPRSPYSIHAIARTGYTKFGKQIGDWFEPTTISEALRLLVQQHSPNGLKMYVPKDGIIYRQDVYQLCMIQPADGPSRQGLGQNDDDSTGSCDLESSNDDNDDDTLHNHNPDGDDTQHQHPTEFSAESECEPSDGTFDTSDQPWHPLVILVPVRLGIQYLNPIYIPTLKAFFAFPQCLGAIGGKPHSSFYFVGYQDNDVLYMDPHLVQPVVKMDDDPLFPIESYHMEIPQSMPFVDIDPSMALGFLCSTKAQFDDFCANVAELGRLHPCVFSVAEENVTTMYKATSSYSSSSSSSSTRRGDTSEGTSSSCSILLDDDDEEYVLV